MGLKSLTDAIPLPLVPQDTNIRRGVFASSAMRRVHKGVKPKSTEEEEHQRLGPPPPHSAGQRFCILHFTRPLVYD